MKVVIDIPEEMVMALKQGSFGAKYNMYDLVGCVMNGTPLPKAENHGFIAVCDSMDAVTQEVVNKLKSTVFVGDEDCSYCFDIMEIFKADGGDAV